MDKTLKNIVLRGKIYFETRIAAAYKMIHSISEEVESVQTPFHSHDFYEVAVILRGSGVHHWARSSISFRPGYIFILRPGEIHHYDYTESLTMINFMYSPKFFKKYKKDLSILPGARELLFEKTPLKKLCAGTSVIAELDILYNRIADEMQNQHPESNLLSQVYLLNALILVLQCYSNSDEKLKPHSAEIESAILYMHRHFDQEIKLSKLAKQVGLSASSFYNKFCQAMGKPPKQWLLEFRIRKAATFLLRSDQKIFEIAKAAGFADPLYFSRLFHKITGFTPKEYRKQEHSDFSIIHDQTDF